MQNTYDDDVLFKISTDILTLGRKKGVHVLTAESCTAGWVAKCLTDISGSSEVVCGGFVTYTDAIKHALLGVQTHTLAQFTAVSEDVAHEMALGALRASASAVSNPAAAIAVTGYTEPVSEENPRAGTVFIHCHGTNGVARLFNYQRPAPRKDARRYAVYNALMILRDMLKEEF